MEDYRESAAHALRDATKQADRIVDPRPRTRAHLRIALAYAQLAAIENGLPPAPLPHEADDERR